MFKKAALVTIIITTIFSTLIPNTYALQCRDAAGTVTPSTSGSCGAGSTAIPEITDFEVIFSTLVTIAGTLIGFAFFLMMIVGGVRYLMSGGDPKSLQAAKGTITWAIIGLALFALSFTILIIIQAFTGVNVTIFKIGV